MYSRKTIRKNVYNNKKKKNRFNNIRVITIIDVKSWKKILDNKFVQ